MRSEKEIKKRLYDHIQAYWEWQGELIDTESSLLEPNDHLELCKKRIQEVELAIGELAWVLGEEPTLEFMDRIIEEVENDWESQETQGYQTVEGEQ